MDNAASGWRIEPRYANDVLIGNWFEERRQYERSSHKSDSSYRRDFFKRPLQLPDVTQRRKYWLRNDGLSQEMLLGHHGNAYENYTITWYDEYYNKRENTRLPKLREWDSSRLAWIPEKSDYPCVGAPTNWGLRQKLEKRWKTEGGPPKVMGEFDSTYSSDYLPPSKADISAARYAVHKERSVNFVPNNSVNKDVRPRNTALPTQMPENFHGELTVVAT